MSLRPVPIALSSSRTTTAADLMKPSLPALLCLLPAVLIGSASLASDRPDEPLAVNITPELSGVTIELDGEPVRIQRNQDSANTITPSFQRTSRRCPPFCVQPMRVARGVETIGEIEMLGYLQRIADGDPTVLLIDSRGPDWVRRGTIPGAQNIHYKRLSLRSAKEEDIADLLEDTFGAQRTAEFWNFSRAKTLVLFCNGAWCGQSPTNIRSLLRIGYPPSKIKWYRGGMQDWETMGLTTVTPD
jgi:rhodanese-related sulfurtransferase